MVVNAASSSGGCSGKGGMQSVVDVTSGGCNQWRMYGIVAVVDVTAGRMQMKVATEMKRLV